MLMRSYVLSYEAEAETAEEVDAAFEDAAALVAASEVASAR